ncbi:hypothetical protein AAG906_022672 [Vitis piasezkii]
MNQSGGGARWYLSSCSIKGRRGYGILVSHLLFVDGMLNRSVKSEIFRGKVENMEALALEFGCKVGGFQLLTWGFLWVCNTSPWLFGIGRVLERKPHLVKWDTVSSDKRKGDLGVRRLSTLNRALSCNERGVWCRILEGNQEGRVSLQYKVVFSMEDGRRVKFWKGKWCGNFALCDSFPFVCHIVGLIERGRVWSLRCSRPFND